MIFTLICNIRPVGVLCFFFLLALAGCGGGGGTSMSLEDALSLALATDQVPATGELSGNPDRSVEDGNTPGLSGESVLPTDTTAPVTETAPDSSLLTSQAPGTTGPDGLTATGVSTGIVVVSGTTPGSRGLADLPRDNPDAADLLDHWGHRPMGRILDGLSLMDADAEADGADLQALRAAAQAEGEELDGPVLLVGGSGGVAGITETGETGTNAVIAPNLFDGDEVRILGGHRGITYGRWTGGPADTLSIEFDLSQAGPAMRDDPEFRAMLERTGKVWSQRIADTWSTWVWPAGALKGKSADYPDYSIEFRAGEDGETSTGLEIAVTDADLEGAAGRGGPSHVLGGDTWEVHFGSIVIDRDHLRTASAARLFHTLTHEIGHVLGSWWGYPSERFGAYAERFGAYSDEAAGTWSGPNVVAIHGGPAPFQDNADPRAWVDGERDPLASEYDFAHSGVCASVMAYCSGSAALRPFLPHAIDFAFLADLGLTIRDETTRPETYGLAGWTEHAGFTLSVSRALAVGLADPQPYYDRWGNRWTTLDVVDLLQAEADAFGYRSTGDLSLSYPGVGALGTVRYAGGLLGAALDRAGLPPVLGNANLAVNLGTLDGTASFTSLTVYPNGLAEPFAGGRLHYPFALSANAMLGTDPRSTLLADFYGPGHEEVAGTLHDPRAGLLASFGATHDDRPSREDVVASADYLYGRSFRSGSTDPANDGRHVYRCGTDAACEVSRTWNNWTTTTRDRTLASTAGWPGQGSERTEADYDFVRVIRQTAASTDGGQGRYAMDSYMGTLEYVTFGTGFEGYSHEWTDEHGTPPGSQNLWSGFQGTMSGGLPDGVARWSGLMVGHQFYSEWDETPFVKGLATVAFWPSTNRVDVVFSDVVSRDGQRALPDFSFEDLWLTADGTFAGGGTSGVLNGAFFGPDQEEVAGEFHHDEPSVVGSFGARRLPDTVTLEATGTTTPIGNVAEGEGFYSFNDWGFWGQQYDETVFGAFLATKISNSSGGHCCSYEGPFRLVEGTPTGSNPVSGTAVWSGQVRAIDTHADNYLRPVSGTAQLEVDFSRATIDVDFTDLDQGHADLSWQALPLTGGAFRGTQANATINGAFYGEAHQGAAGEFWNDRLQGIYGAVRN